ncbi:MAG: hypothetical protein IH782_09930, partial [candidate division NC10 bacterium]|nr:hypothetical protein [candidate division NC10 bacterium]
MSAARSKSPTAQFGMMGLGVMGQNLALNIERNGYPVAVWDRETEWVDEFVQKTARGKQVIGTKSIQDFVRALERPRKIMMMIKAGAPVDWTIDQLKPYLEEGDIIIDGGNSHFQDTRRREKELAADALRLVGGGKRPIQLDQSVSPKDFTIISGILIRQHDSLFELKLGRRPNRPFEGECKFPRFFFTLVFR